MGVAVDHPRSDVGAVGQAHVQPGAGGGEVGTVTVGERAMRVICCSIAVHWGGVFLGLATFIAVLLTAILAAATAIGLVQLVVAVRRDLLALPDEPVG